VLQTSATRSNTAELRKIARTWERATLLAGLTITGLLFTVVSVLFKDEILEGVKKIFHVFRHSALADQLSALLTAAGLF
jgi:hypothetical protein